MHYGKTFGLQTIYNFNKMREKLSKDLKNINDINIVHMILRSSQQKLKYFDIRFLQLY